MAIVKAKKEKGILLIDILVFLTVLLIGADSFGFSFLGFNIRVVQIIALAAVFVILITKMLVIPKSRLLILFSALMFISMIFSYSKFTSVPYFIWTVFNYVIIIGLFYSYIIFYGFDRFFRIYRDTMFIQSILVLIQFVMEFIGHPIPFFNTGTYKGIPRPALWFYETSYLATYFSIWMTIAFFSYFVYKRKSYFKDVICSLIGMVLCTATTGFVAIAFIAVLTVIGLFMCSVKTGKCGSLVLFLLFVAIVLIFVFIVFDDIVDVFVMRLFSLGIAESSGGRMDMYAEIWQVFINNPLFGVGPGAYGYYMGQDRSYVPSNVTLELLSTCGLFATIVFYLFIAFLILDTYKKCKRSGNYLGCCFAIAMFVFIVILQANQNYLRLYMWMMFGILLALNKMTPVFSIKRRRAGVVKLGYGGI